MCCVFDADGVVVDAVCVCEKCEVWVMWELHDVVGVAEGMEPVVSMVGVVCKDGRVSLLMLSGSDLRTRLLLRVWWSMTENMSWEMRGIFQMSLS